MNLQQLMTDGSTFPGLGLILASIDLFPTRPYAAGILFVCGILGVLLPGGGSRAHAKDK